MSTVLKKLRVTKGLTLQLVNAPGNYAELVGSDLAEITQIKSCKNEVDCVHMFVADFSEFTENMPIALKAIKYDGLFWISYPKGSSKIKTDINRDSMWQASEAFGIRPVTQISINSIWSAIRFRPIDAVGK